MNRTEEEERTEYDQAVQAYEQKCEDIKKRREACAKAKKITLEVIAYVCVVVFMIVAALVISVALTRS